MTAKSCSNGHQVEFINDIWRYCDTKEPVDTTLKECKHCGKHPTKEGYDSCIGYLPNVSSACCGHSVEKPYVMLTTGEHLCFDTIEGMKEYFRV